VGTGVAGGLSLAGIPRLGGVHSGILGLLANAAVSALLAGRAGAQPAAAPERSEGATAGAPSASAR